MGKVRHYLNGNRCLEEIETEEAEERERLVFDHVEDYDFNHNFFTRTKIIVAGEISEEEVEEVFARIEREIMEFFKEGEELEEWEIFQKLFNVFYDFYGADPSYKAEFRYVGGDFPRREILIKFY